MLHLWTVRSPNSATAAGAAKSRPQLWRSAFLLSLGLAVSLASVTYHDGFSQSTAQPAGAASAETAPPELKNLLSQVDAAANSQNISAVMKFYSDNFTQSDGITRQMLEQSLTKLWQQYPKLTYRTELKSWQQDGTGLQAETITYITGTQQVSGRELKLEGMLQSRQRVEGQKIVRQEILTEQNRITSGEKPPTIKISLPEQVGVGQEYSFDAIVQEPLGNDLLLGKALEEPVKPGTFLNPARIDLEPLLSGGLFKLGRAPKSPTHQWLSAIVIRHSGMTMVTQRLRVVGREVASPK